MNIRILKKKSKQAKKMLIDILNMKDNQFWPADGIDNHHNFDINCKLNCKRSFCKHTTYALKGTPMIYDGVSYDLEEKTAFEFLQDTVIDGTLCPETFPDAFRLSGYSLKQIEIYQNWMNDI